MKRILNKLKDVFKKAKDSTATRIIKVFQFITFNIHSLTLLSGLGFILLAVFLLHYIAGLFVTGIVLIFLAFLLNQTGV